VTRPDFYSFLRHIWETEDQEISCTECFDLVPQYVDLEITGQVAHKKLPRLRQHLNQCGVCREEYEVLRDLARGEAEGRLPPTDELRNSF